MTSQGSIIVRVYTSNAYLPLENAVVTITQIMEKQRQRLQTFRITDQSGLTEPVWVSTPDRSESLRPDILLQPYTTVSLRVDCPEYRSVIFEGIQIFPDIETIQGVQLVPIFMNENIEQPITYHSSVQLL